MNSAVHRIDRDRTTLARSLQRTIQRSADDALLHAIAATRIGVDPVDAVRKASQQFAPDIARAIVKATLQGVRRTALEAQAAGVAPIVKLSRESDRKEDEKRILALLLLLGWTDKDMAPIAAKARTQAEAYTTRLTGPLLRRMDETKRKWGQVKAAPQSAAEAIPAPSQGQSLADWYRADAVPLRQKTADLREVWRKAGFGFDEPWAPQSWADTIAQRAFDDGRDRAAKTPAIDIALWGYRFDATLDSKTTVMCRTLHNWRAPKDEPAIKTLRPKCHWGCRSHLIEVFKSDALHPPTPWTPDVTPEQWAEFYAIKAKYLSSSS